MIKFFWQLSETGDRKRLVTVGQTVLVLRVPVVEVVAEEVFKVQLSHLVLLVEAELDYLVLGRMALADLILVSVLHLEVHPVVLLALRHLGLVVPVLRERTVDYMVAEAAEVTTPLS